MLEKVIMFYILCVMSVNKGLVILVIKRRRVLKVFSNVNINVKRCWRVNRKERVIDLGMLI